MRDVQMPRNLRLRQMQRPSHQQQLRPPVLRPRMRHEREHRLWTRARHELRLRRREPELDGHVVHALHQVDLDRGEDGVVHDCVGRERRGGGDEHLFWWRMQTNGEW